MVNRQLLRHIVGFALLSLFTFNIFGLLPLRFLSSLETINYDMRVRLGASNTVDQRVVIVDLDEKSFAEVGIWPWGRDRVADLVDNLFDYYRVGVVGFDLTFPKSDDGSGLPVLERLAKGPLKDNKAFLSEFSWIRPTLERDELLAESLEDRSVILGYYFRQSRDTGMGISGHLPAPVITLAKLGKTNIPFVRAAGYRANLDILQDSASSGGFIDNPLTDQDGVFRRFPMLQEYNGKLYQSLPLAMIRAILGEPNLTLGINRNVTDPGRLAETDLELISLGSNRIPVDKQGALYIPYRGKQGSFPYVSAADIINKSADHQVLQDAIVLVGTTAIGLMDRRSTPVQHMFPGVEIHANIISGILDGIIKHDPDFQGLMVGVVIMLLLGISMTVIFPRIPLSWMAFYTLVIIVLLVWGNILAWQKLDLVFPLASPIFFILSLFTWHLSFSLFIESHGKSQLSNIFGQHLPEKMIDEICRSNEQVTLAGERRNMTVMFSYMRGFATISEGLQSEELPKLMNGFLTPITRIVHKHRGTLDKYVGDSVMAFWGAPMIDRNHAKNSLKAAIEITKNMDSLRAEYQTRGWPPLKIGIGINSGLMNVGNMGSDFRMAYTVMGDTVNLASRLEGFTKQYGVMIIVGEETRVAVPSMVFRELDLVQIKGRVDPVSIYEPLDFAKNVTEDAKAQLKTYHHALALYRQQSWQEADQVLQNLKQRDPERMIYDIYLSRIHHYKTHSPGVNWNGVFTFNG